ncbi:MAG: efflux transporter outer membrane subunit [Hyphomicrobiales bacterium]|nr:efflux transporter outer membrane subunit [Hyphomicrobiales bacterium]MDE2113704.1 efflux transporter outer membrane subunit [Hyphomicrobiales bacterium]
MPQLTEVAINPDIPAHFEGVKANQRAVNLNADWWRNFHLPELSRIAKETLESNFDIAVAQAQIEQAEAAARLAGVPLLPSATLTSNVTHSKSSNFDSSRSAGEQTVHDLGLSASYEIDFWGKNRAAARAGAENLLASQYDAQIIRLSSLAAAANGYFQVLASRQRIALAQANIKDASSVLRLIQQRVAVGTATGLNVAQQQNLVDNLRASIPPLQLSASQNVSALALLTGRPPERFSAKGARLSAAHLPSIAPGLPSRLLARRPDIEAAEAQLEAASANLASARAAFFPSIQLTASGGFQSFALNTLLDPKNTFYSLAAGLTQPIFDNGKLQATFDQTLGNNHQLLANYHKVVVSAFTDVDKALASVRYLAAQEALQRRSLASARTAYDLSRKQLLEGTIDLVTLLNTQTAVYQAQDALVQTRLGRLQAVVSLYQALGGGWEGPELAKVTMQ